MATTLYNVPDGEIGLRYREPFISAGLNAKYQGFVPVGVYDGFAPQPGPAISLLLTPGDSGYSAAVVTSSLDAAYQISARLSGTQLLDLSTFTSTTVAVVLEASYTFPSVTSAVVKAYNLGTETPPASACVLCRVVVPAVGPIPAANISLQGRTLPWDTRTRDSIPFISVVKNGSFDFGLEPISGGTPVPPFWAFTGNGSTEIDNVTKPSPAFIGNVLQYTTAGAGAATGKIRQYIGVPLGGSNGRFRMSVYFNRLVAPSSGNPVLRAEFRQTSDDTTVYSATLALTTTGTYETTLDLDAITTLQSVGNYLAFVEVDANSANYGSAAPVFYITSIEVELEAPAGGAIDALLEATGEKRLTKLTLIDPANQSAGGFNSDLTYDQPTDKVNISSSFGVDDNLSVTGTSAFTGATTHTGGVRTPSVDSIGATALTIGPTNQTGLTVGRVGATTAVRGLITSIGVNASDGSVTIGRTGSTTAIDSATANIGVSGLGTTTVRSATMLVLNNANVDGNFSVNTNQFTVTATTGAANVAGDFSVATSKFTVAQATGNTNVAGTLNSTGNFSVGSGLSTFSVIAATGATAVAGSLAVTGITTATGAINANGGIGRSTSGTLAVGNDSDVTLISIGTASSTGGVGISQTGQTTTIYGNLVVNGTASLGAVTISGVDSAAAGGTVNIGTTNAGFVDIGNVANSTTTRVLGPVLLNDALATKSRIDRGNAGTLLIGSSNETTGAGTATSVFLGRAPNSGGTTTSIDGATINVGGNSNTPYASTINIGTQTSNTATITIGTAPTSGTVTTTVQGNTLNLGTDADAGTISIGTTAPTTARTITLGANNANQTTIINGGPITIGGAATTTASIVNNASGVVQIARYASGAQVHFASQATGNVFLGSGDGTIGPPLVQVGGTTAGTNIINTAIQGDTITLGTNADTNSLTIGSGTSGIVRIKQYLDGNAGQLDIGTNTTQTTTSVTLGRSGIPVYVRGSTVYLDPVGGVATLEAAPNASTISLGYNCTNTNIAINAASGIIQIGPYGANTLDTRIYGQEIYVDSPNTSKILLGNNTSGQMRVHGYLDGNGGGLSLGTNATATTGNVSIAHGAVATTVNSPLYMANNLIDRATGAALDIGTVNATTVSLGKSGQQQRAKGSFVAEGALYADNGTGGVSTNTRLAYPVFGGISQNLLGQAQSITSTYFRVLAGSAWASLNLTPSTGPVGSEGFTAVPYGVYEYRLQGRFTVNSVTGSPTYIQLIIEGTNVDFPGALTSVTYTLYRDGGGTIANNDVLPFACSGFVTIGTSSATGALDAAVRCNPAGTTVSVNLDYSLTICRVSHA